MRRWIGVLGLATACGGLTSLTKPGDGAVAGDTDALVGADTPADSEANETSDTPAPPIDTAIFDTSAPAGGGPGGGSGGGAGTETQCANGRDDDADGDVDCEDADCGAVCDQDGDGFLRADGGGDDCDDLSAAVRPGATEACNTVDDDCDGLVDDDDPGVTGGTLYYVDADGDGYGLAGQTQLLCDAAGLPFASVAGDCNDASAAANPGAAERLCDGVDNDCAAGSPDVADGDGDGYPSCDALAETFEAALSASWVSGGSATWARVTNAARSGARALSNGDIGDSQSTWVERDIVMVASGTVKFWVKTDTEAGYDFLRFRVDGSQQGEWSGNTAWTLVSVNVAAGAHTLRWTYSKDGSASTTADAVWIDDVYQIDGSDCLDSNASVNPGAPEVCGGLDDDCDGLVDDADTVEGGGTTYYVDVDGDGYGDPARAALSCGTLGGVLTAGDCNDANAAVRPGAAEVTCDGLDNDCSAVTLDGPDGDGDGTNVCSDCNDANAAVRPGATDTCGDGVDANCDGWDICPAVDVDFESPLSAAWLTGGDATWARQSSAAHGGTMSLTHGDIGDSQSSWVETTVTLAAAGTARFWYKTDTESNYDFLRFRVDGVVTGEWSGVNNWTLATYSLAAGTHTLRWTYSKDVSASTTADAVWIDDVLVY